MNGFNPELSQKLKNKLSGLLTERQKKEIIDKIKDIDKAQLTKMVEASNISNMSENELMNIITIFLGVTVGATATAEAFLTPATLGIVALGLIAFIFSTIGGLLLGNLMYVLTKGKVNPLIGSAGVSAVPMAARVSQMVGQKENPSNFLLMHAMGPNVAGVIGSAVAAGVFLSMFTGL